MNVARAKQDLEREEGRRAKPYLDTEDVWTVGVGHNMNVPLCDTAIDAQFDHDFREAVRGAKRVVKVFDILDDTRQQVVVGMVYQMGTNGVSRFPKFLRALARGDWELAADEMLDSQWAREQTPARAERYAARMRTGADE